MVTQVGLVPCSYLTTNNDSMFRKNRMMLKLVCYSTTPEKSSKAAIQFYVLAVFSLYRNMLQDYLPNACTSLRHFLTDYRAVPPFLPFADALAVSP